LSQSQNNPEILINNNQFNCCLMQKKHLIVVALALLPLLSAAQAVLNDAARLAPYFYIDAQGKVALLVLKDEEPIKTVANIWKNYYDGAAIENPFFSGIEDLPVEKSLGPPISTAAVSGVSAVSGVALGGPFSANVVAQGLAGFLAKRTKAELTAAFFQEFKDTLNQHPFAKLIFPETVRVLRQIDQELYQFDPFLEALRFSFNEDLSMLPGNFGQLLRGDQLKIKPFYKVMASDGLNLTQMALNGQSPAQMIQYMASPLAYYQETEAQIGLDSSQRRQLTEASGYFQTIELLDQSLHRNNASDDWLTDSEVREVLRDPVTQQLYLGLLWQRAKGIRLGNDYLRDLLGRAQVLGTWRTFFRSMSANAAAMDEWSSTNTTKTTFANINRVDSANLELWVRKFNFTVRVLRFGLEWCKTLQPDTNIPLWVDNTLTAAEQVGRLHFQVKRENYTAAIATATTMLTTLEVPNKSVETFFYYASFMALMAQARTPEEAERAIERFALPTGSSRMKKVPGRTTFAIQAFTGGSGGVEKRENRDFSAVGALSAPVGLSLNRGTDNRRYWGVFIPVIDVGALTAFQFNNNYYNDLPALKWSNLIAPGLYLTQGWKGKRPLAWGVGAQLGPSLRTVSADQRLDTSGGFRAGAFLTVDIPMFYLFKN
jgi:hypothetical protein